MASATGRDLGAAPSQQTSVSSSRRFPQHGQLRNLINYKDWDNQEAEGGADNRSDAVDEEEMPKAHRNMHERVAQQVSCNPTEAQEPPDQKWKG